MILDGEKGIEQFNQRVCPDLTVSSYDDQNMIFIVEIKNLRTKQGKGIIRTAISENFKQLRYYCLQRKLPVMWGISTNFGLWVFTRYSKIDEMLKNTNPFQVTESIELMDLHSYKIKEEELQKLVLILDMLAADIIKQQMASPEKFNRYS